MSPFCAIFHRPSILAQHPHADYFASDEFRKRINFEGEEGLSARVRGAIFMLQNCALDPRDDSDGVLRALNRGLVMLELFGVSNPLGIFELPAGKERNAIRAAIKANLNSRMYQAAQHTLFWRGRSHQRQRYEDAVMDTFRSTLEWPSAADFKENLTSAQARQTDAIAQMHKHLASVRNLRNERLAVIHRAATPGVNSWTEFLANIAAAAFLPK